MCRFNWKFFQDPVIPYGSTNFKRRGLSPIPEVSEENSNEKSKSAGSNQSNKSGNHMKKNGIPHDFPWPHVFYTIP